MKEALLIGFTRMGILHNLARLTSPRLPDHAEGGIGEWVTVSAFVIPAAGPEALSFDVIVAGERAGAAWLELDSEGEPRARRQTVEFPGGEMRVVERYSAVRIRRAPDGPPAIAVQGGDPLIAGYPEDACPGCTAWNAPQRPFQAHPQLTPSFRPRRILARLHSGSGLRTGRRG